MEIEVTLIIKYSSDDNNLINKVEQWLYLRK